MFRMKLVFSFFIHSLHSFFHFISPLATLENVSQYRSLLCVSCVYWLMRMSGSHSLAHSSWGEDHNCTYWAVRLAGWSTVGVLSPWPSACSRLTSLVGGFTPAIFAHPVYWNAEKLWLTFFSHMLEPNSPTERSQPHPHSNAQGFLNFYLQLSLLAYETWIMKILYNICITPILFPLIIQKLWVCLLESFKPMRKI